MLGRFPVSFSGHSPVVGKNLASQACDRLRVSWIPQQNDVVSIETDGSMEPILIKKILAHVDDGHIAMMRYLRENVSDKIIHRIHQLVQDEQ